MAREYMVMWAFGFGAWGPTKPPLQNGMSRCPYGGRWEYHSLWEERGNTRR
ncbi:uncharacterized protein G2W53_038445 [Senna tora]|uniref:Uncharacterized protein n=1 Tax=Senna tora TaxID=362788 RepID=A0A834W6W5_9FABA|nr:uncharacterized protein G2W53_038445 [Senna tora]